MPSSYTAFDFALSPSWRLASSISSPSFFSWSHFGDKRLLERRVQFRRQAVQRPPEPDVEEVHQVRVRNRVVVRRIGDDGIDNRLMPSLDCGLILTTWGLSTPALAIRAWSMYRGNPVKLRRDSSADVVRQRHCFGKVPGDGQREAREGVDRLVLRIYSRCRRIEL